MKTVKRHDIERQTIYAFKSPLKGYTLGASEGERVNPITGEITRPYVHARKHDLRTGDLARLAILLSKHSAYSLMVCSGDGVRAQANVRRRNMQQHCARLKEQALSQHLARLRRQAQSA